MRSNLIPLGLVAGLAAAAMPLLPAQPRRALPNAALQEPSYHGFLFVDGIRGPVDDPRYKDWFYLRSYRLSVSDEGSGPVWSRLVVDADMDVAVPTLALAAVEGNRISVVRAVIFEASDDQNPVLEIALEQALVSGHGTDGAGLQGGLQLEFNFQKITTKYFLGQGPPVEFRCDVYAGGCAAPGGATVPFFEASARQAYFGFLSVPGVRGGATRSGYQDWIPITDYGMSVVHEPRTGGGGGNGRPTMSPVTVHALLDRSLPELARDCATARAVGRVVLHVFAVANDTSPLLIFELEGATIERAAGNAAKAGGGIEIRIEFGTIRWTHIDPTTGTPTSGCWDRINQRRC